MVVMNLRDALHTEILHDAMLMERDVASLVLRRLLTLQFDNETARQLNAFDTMEPIPAPEIQRLVPKHQLRIRKNLTFVDFYEARRN